MNIVCIIQARMASVRLPGKVTKSILGIPMIVHILNRLKHVKNMNQVVVATSINPENDQLVDIVQKQNSMVYRGEENDVLGRYIDVANITKADIIIRVTGDCPLIDAGVIDQLIANFQNTDVDYMRVDVPETFSRGFDAEVFTKEALMKTNALAVEQKYREHVTLYMYEHSEMFKISKMKPTTKHKHPHYRLCVDTIEDFQLICKIYEDLYKPNNYFGIEEIMRYLDENPFIADINRGIKQKKV